MRNQTTTYLCHELLNELHININGQTAVRLGPKRRDGSGRPIMLKREREEDVHKVLRRAEIYALVEEQTLIIYSSLQI